MTHCHDFLGQNCTRLMEWSLLWSCRSYLVRLEFRSLAGFHDEAESERLAAPVSRGTEAAWFFSRPQGPRRPQHVIYEQRQIAADTSYEITRGDTSRRARRNSNIPDANREPRVFRLVHNMLPLERICQTAAKVLMNGMIHGLAFNLGKLEGPHCSPEPWNDGKFIG